MDQDLLQLVNRVIASLVGLLTCHFIIRTLIVADWLKKPREFLDRAYQTLMKRLGSRTFYSPSSCYLCCSLYVCQTWFFVTDGISVGSVLHGLAMAGALDLIKGAKSGQMDE